jgi:hypothetical protein
VYILVRSVLAPPLVAWFVYSLWFQASAIPLAWRAPMGACVTVGILGSQVRVLDGTSLYLWGFGFVRDHRVMEGSQVSARRPCGLLSLPYPACPCFAGIVGWA